MAISYKKLFKLLIDRNLKKKDLQRATGLSASSITKLANEEALQSQGWTVIRFWGKEIAKQTEECVRSIEEAISRRAEGCPPELLKRE